MAPADLARLSDAIALSLTTVYWVVVGLAVIALAVSCLVPAGARTPQQSPQ
jgi:hypothetical protein